MLQLLVQKILTIAILVYFGFGLILFLFERRYVYYPNFPTRHDFGDCPELAEAEKVFYKDARFYFKHVSDSAVVMYHGNAGSVCDRAIFAQTFEKLGYSYLLVEYPGYGNDPTGGPSKARILENVGTIREFLGERAYRSIVLAGESLGVGVAAYHASFDKADKLIFISPYYELADMAGWMGIAYPVRLLMRENYTPGLWLKDVRSPMLFVYASADEIIPAWSAKKLYNSVNTEKKEVKIEATHNTLYDHAEFFNSIEEFLK